MILSKQTPTWRVILALLGFSSTATLRTVDFPMITLNDGLARPTPATLTPAGNSSLFALRSHSTLPEKVHP